MSIFNCYVSSPEGKHKQSWVMSHDSKNTNCFVWFVIGLDDLRVSWIWFHLSIPLSPAVEQCGCECCGRVLMAPNWSYVQILKIAYNSNPLIYPYRQFSWGQDWKGSYPNPRQHWGRESYGLLSLPWKDIERTSLKSVVVFRKRHVRILIQALEGPHTHQLIPTRKTQRCASPGLLRKLWGSWCCLKSCSQCSSQPAKQACHVSKAQ